jgi:putative transposase
MTDTVEATAPVLRAYRFALDPTDAQLGDLARHAGATRWAANRGIAWMSQAQLAWEQRRDDAIAQLAGPMPAPPVGLDEKATAAWTAQVRGERIKVWDKLARPILKAQSAKLAADTKRLDEQRKALMAAVKDKSRRDLLDLKQQLAAVRRGLLQLKKLRFEQGDAIPSSMDCQAMWREIRDQDAEDGGSPWHAEVSVYCFTNGFDRAQAAMQNWMASRTGARAGRAMGRPKFKKKGRSTDSFTLFHDVKNPSIRPDGYRRLTVPRIGSLRLHQSCKPLARLIDRGHAVVKSVTISRGGTRWYASVLCELTPAAMVHREEVSRARQKVSKKRQAMRPAVGVEWGVRKLAVLSDETVFANPRHGNQHQRALRKASQAVTRKPLKRGEKASANRVKAVRHLGRVHHRIAEARRGALNQASAKIVINYPAIAVRDLAVKQMTRSAKGTVEAPGADVKVKARFNRAILDTAPGELRRQLEYKAAQWGTEFRSADAGLPSSQTCSRCGWRDPSIPLRQVVFRCGNIKCGVKLDREVNAARNILHHAVAAASDSGEALNACGGDSPSGDRRLLLLPSKQEGQFRRRDGSSRGSDPPASTGS